MPRSAIQVFVLRRAYLDRSRRGTLMVSRIASLRAERGDAIYYNETRKGDSNAYTCHAFRRRAPIERADNRLRQSGRSRSCAPLGGLVQQGRQRIGVGELR